MLLSIIIPIAPQEENLHSLHDSLVYVPDVCEIIFVRSENGLIEHLPFTLDNKSVQLITALDGGRAQQMNAGASIANGEFLWFLHVDSVFDAIAIKKLCQAVRQFPDGLLYFDLRFLKDATPLMKINQWGVHFRSRVLKMPFGDQGLCIRRDLFDQCGTYQESLPYGEDHILVWHALQNGLSVCSVQAPLFTSARKYRTQGWLKTTMTHVFLFIKQALPELIKLLNIKLQQRFNKAS